MNRETRVELILLCVIVVIVGGVLAVPKLLLKWNEAPRGAGAMMVSAVVEEAAPQVASEGAKAAPAPEVARSSGVAAPVEPVGRRVTAVVTTPVVEPAPVKSPAPVAAPSAGATLAGGAGWRDAWKEGEGLVAAGKAYEGRAALTKAILAAPEGAEREQIKAALDKMNEEMVFSPRPTPDSVMHTVESGDSYWVLSQKYNCPIGLIKRINKKTTDNLRARERLKVLQGEWSGLVQKSRFRLIILLNKHYVKEFSVAIGQYDRTPEGVFEIDSKQEKPVWYSPEGGVFAYGDPKNILGTRWLGFKDTPEFQGYGIHGTPFPETIGKAASNGCIRLRNAEVEEVYDLLRKGDKVTIAQ